MDILWIVLWIPLYALYGILKMYGELNFTVWLYETIVLYCISPSFYFEFLQYFKTLYYLIQNMKKFKNFGMYQSIKNIQSPFWRADQISSEKKWVLWHCHLRDKCISRRSGRNLTNALPRSISEMWSTCSGWKNSPFERQCDSKHFQVTSNWQLRKKMFNCRLAKNVCFPTVLALSLPQPHHTQYVRKMREALHARS